VAQASTTEVAEASTGRGEVEEEDAEMKIGPRPHKQGRRFGVDSKRECTPRDDDVQSSQMHESMYDTLLETMGCCLCFSPFFVRQVRAGRRT
jgi:hypothetical protein